MSIAHMRRAGRTIGRVPEGGGLTAPSLTDGATDGDIMESDTGRGPSGLEGDVNIDYDDTYEDQGVPDGVPEPDAYTAEEARQDMASFDERPFDGAQVSRDVAQQWNAGVLVLQPLADPYLIAGADPQRKRLLIRNITPAGLVGVADVLLSEEPTMTVPGAGSFVLQSLVTGAINDPQEIEFTHTGNVWARVDQNGSKPATLTYALERYAR